jgi:hypothetical protein
MVGPHQGLGGFVPDCGPRHTGAVAKQEKLMNCKPGDLAMIIGDEESCIMNIGRIVRVHGPLAIIENYQCWPIVPIHSDPIMVREGSDLKLWHNVKLDDDICHVDAWLKPIPPMTDEELHELINFREPEEVSA